MDFETGKIVFGSPGLSDCDDRSSRLGSRRGPEVGVYIHIHLVLS